MHKICPGHISVTLIMNNVGQVRMTEAHAPQAEASPATGNHVSQYYLYMVKWSATKPAPPLGR